jgi:GWxTD domain-containing protein
MFYKFLIFALTLLVFCLSVLAQERKVKSNPPSVENELKHWLEKDALYIITPKEKEEFLKLKTIEEAEDFIEKFWKRRDPTPETEENEFRETYYERIAFANEHFTSGIGGWRTDRGMVHIMYGKPDKIEKGRGNFEGLQNVLFEKWTYENLTNKKQNTEITFIDPTESKEFRFEKDKRENLLEEIREGFLVCIGCKSNQIKRNIIQLTPYGYISLPKTYWAFMDTDYHDAWSGIIEPLDGSFQIRFFDGLIESIFDKQKKHIKWKKQLKTENYTIDYALAVYGETKHILAKINSATFQMKIMNDSDIDKFLEIIRNYQKGRCETCFDSHNTKNIKKVFEKLSEND